MAENYYKATLCNLASAVLHTGINGTVVVVGVQCLFAFRAFWGYRLLHTAGTRMCMCLCAFAARNAKSMTVANGGNAIEDRRSAGFVRWLPG